jgi:o-succinylbenzoate synthase
MRITDADVWQMATEVNHQSRNRYGGTTRLERALIRLCDEEGHEGWGEAMPVSFTDEAISDAAGALKAAAATLKGRKMEDPLAEIGGLADFSGLSAARSGLEAAFLDLMSQRSGTPLADAFGGERRSEFLLDGPIGLVSPKEAIEKAGGFLAQGITTFKVKVGADPDTDAKRVLCLRKEFGPDIHLRMDANGGYTPEEALHFAKRMEKADIEHFEQPVLPAEERCFEIFRQIRAMGVPIAVDESLFSLDHANRLIGEDAVDVGVIKIAKFGGPLAAREVARAFEAAGKVCVLSSSYESFIGKAMGMTLATSLENCARAQELGHSAPEAEFAEWRHNLSGGTMSRTEGAGLGARGLADCLEALSVSLA